MSLEPDVFTSIHFSCFAEGWYFTFYASAILYFSECTGPSVEPRMMFLLFMVAFSFKETGIHQEGEQGEQLDYKHRAGEQAEYVLFYCRLVRVFPADQLS